MGSRLMAIVAEGDRRRVYLRTELRNAGDASASEAGTLQSGGLKRSVPMSTATTSLEVPACHMV